MRYLIETNVFIRMINDYNVPVDIKNLLDDYENIIYISSESVKEFIHLVQNEKIKLQKS